MPTCVWCRKPSFDEKGLRTYKHNAAYQNAVSHLEIVKKHHLLDEKYFEVTLPANPGQQTLNYHPECHARIVKTRPPKGTEDPKKKSCDATNNSVKSFDNSQNDAGEVHEKDFDSVNENNHSNNLLENSDSINDSACNLGLDEDDPRDVDYLPEEEITMR